MLQYIEEVINKNEYDIRLKKEKKGYRLLFKTGINRIGILYKISAALYVQNWNIIEMNATTGEGGVVEDSFLIEPMEKRLPYILEYTLVSAIDKLLNSDLTVMSFVAKHPKKYRVLQGSKRKESGKLAIKETGSDSFMLLIETQDRPGLIFEITQVLYRLYFDIVKMESTTIGERAYDKLMVMRDPEKKGRNDAQLLNEALSKIVE
jgi:[protein-PII] uridylyltransferase